MIRWPVFARDRDGCVLFLDSKEALEAAIEITDVEDEEYSLFDRDGRILRLTLPAGTAEDEYSDLGPVSYRRTPESAEGYTILPTDDVEPERLIEILQQVLHKGGSLDELILAANRLRKDDWLGCSRRRGRA